jgi:hypothetical protein
LAQAATEGTTVAPFPVPGPARNPQDESGLFRCLAPVTQRQGQGLVIPPVADGQNPPAQMTADTGGHVRKNFV